MTSSEGGVSREKRFERHKKTKISHRTSTVITRWNGDELPLSLIQFIFAAD